MAVDDHNPSRRALLGAAVGFPLIPLDVAEAGGPLRHVSHGSPPRSGEEWAQAIGAFEAARAEVRAIEAATAGGLVEEEEALMPAHDSACDAMDSALGRVMRAPAPDLAAFAMKLGLFFGHELEPHSVDEAVAAAVLGDARRLAGL